MVAPPNLPSPQGMFGLPVGGMSGILPFTGNVFFVNESTGSDGNTGGMYDPLATLTQALALCADGNNDVVFVTGTVHVSSTLTWSKSKTHLIGLAPNLKSQARARISQTGSTVFTPLVSVTATECIFRNIGSFHGFANASAQICWTDSGGRNEYTNCLFGGMGNATAAAQAGGRSLLVSGSTGENTFRDCQIGLDTITRTGANATLEFASGTPRNTFVNCVLPMLAGDADPLFIKTGAAGAIDRFQWFQGCLFANAIGSTATAITQAVVMAASAGGVLVMQRCTLLGGNTSTNWGDATAMTQMYVDGGAPTAATTGLAVNPT